MEGYSENTRAERRTVGPVTKASATGSGIAAAVTTLTAWILAEGAGVELPEEVRAAVTVILVSLGGVIGGYLPKPGERR